MVANRPPAQQRPAGKGPAAVRLQDRVLGDAQARRDSRSEPVLRNVRNARGLREAGFDPVQVIDTGKDLNVYAKVENQAGCCGPAMTAGSPSESIRRLAQLKNAAAWMTSAMARSSSPARRRRSGSARGASLGEAPEDGPARPHRGGAQLLLDHAEELHALE